MCSSLWKTDKHAIYNRHAKERSPFEVGQTAYSLIGITWRATANLNETASGLSAAQMGSPKQILTRQWHHVLSGNISPAGKEYWIYLAWVASYGALRHVPLNFQQQIFQLILEPQKVCAACVCAAHLTDSAVLPFCYAIGSDRVSMVLVV